MIPSDQDIQKLQEYIERSDLESLRALIDQSPTVIHSQIDEDLTAFDFAISMLQSKSSDAIKIVHLLFESGANTRANRLHQYKFDSPQELIAFLKSNETKPLVFNRACSVVSNYPMHNMWSSIFDPNQPDPKQPLTADQLRTRVDQFYKRLEGFTDWLQINRNTILETFSDRNTILENFSECLRFFDSKYHQNILTVPSDTLTPEQAIAYRCYQNYQDGVLSFQDLKKFIEKNHFDQKQVENLIRKLSPRAKRMGLQWANYRYCHAESAETQHQFQVVLELLSQHVASVYPRIDANLILAIKNTHLAEVKRLIKKGILLNAENGRNADGHNTPLILAIKTHDLKLVALLIQHGAQVNPEYRTETDGSTPLLLALTENKTAIARVLVQHGADVSATRKGFQNPLDLALGTQDLNLIILIIHHANAKISNDIAKRFVTGRIGGLLLDSAVTTGDEKIFSFLMQHDINITNHSPLESLIRADRVHPNFKMHLCNFNNTREFIEYLKQHADPQNKPLFNRACSAVAGYPMPNIWASLFDADQPNSDLPRTPVQIEKRVSIFYQRLEDFSNWYADRFQQIHHRAITPAETWQAFKDYLRSYTTEEGMVFSLATFRSANDSLPYEPIPLVQDLKRLIAEKMMENDPALRITHLYHQLPAQRFHAEQKAARQAAEQRQLEREQRALAANRRIAAAQQKDPSSSDHNSMRL